MRYALLTLPLLLAACATPRELCISQAQEQVSTINQLVLETQANIARGYALQTVQELDEVQAICEGKNPDDSVFTYQCTQQVLVSHEVPVAIDLNAEQAKLNSLLQRQAEMQRQINAQIQQCIAIHPE